MPQRHRGKLIGLLCLGLIVLGFVLIKAPTPIISIAAEPIIDGSYAITNTMISAWVVIVLLALIVFWLYFTKLRDIEKAMVPSGFQNVIEGLLDAFFNIVQLVAGEKNGRRFFPVVASIFLILLFANWFGLFPWNNSFGRTVDLRFEYVELLEIDVHHHLEEVEHDESAQPAELIQSLNAHFSAAYFDPIPFKTAHLDEADERIGAILRDDLSASEIAVREVFAEDPLPEGLGGADLVHAIEERIEHGLQAAGLTEEVRHRYEADDLEAAVEHALLFNLPIAVGDVGEPELSGWVMDSGGVNVVPIKADDFTYDPFLEPAIAGRDGSFAHARIYTDREPESEHNVAPAASEVALPVSLNTAHIGIILKQAQAGVIGIEGGVIERSKGVAEIFPLFRAIATDLNLPLAIALWSFIFVQLWGIQSLGLGTNFGKFIGMGGAAVVKGPIGVVVGLLEVISELARIISFTFRLFGNIFAGEVVLFMAAFLVPLLAATVFYGLELFVGFIQAFVFAMLTLVFAVTAVSHGEHGHDEEEAEETAGH